MGVVRHRSLSLQRCFRLERSTDARHREWGFTLVEVLVVIGIIGVLISLLLPAFARVRDQANKVACLSNLRQCYIALYMYAEANKGCVPFVKRSGIEWSPTQFTTGKFAPDDVIRVPNAWNALQIYTSKNPTVAMCPSRMRQSRTNNNRHWDLSVSPGNWTDGFTTYPLAAGSTSLFTGGFGPEGSLNATGYTVKIHKLPNDFAFVLDLLAIIEPAGSDSEYIQTNHCKNSSVRPAGGNVVYRDGHGAWLNFNTKDWTPSPNTGVYLPTGTKMLNPFSSWGDPYWFSGPSPTRGYVKNSNP
jgi:prepilin-type N-terminal cleavage/methylation domain-containing protein